MEKEKGIVTSSLHAESIFCFVDLKSLLGLDAPDDSGKKSRSAIMIPSVLLVLYSVRFKFAWLCASLHPRVRWTCLWLNNTNMRELQEQLVIDWLDHIL